MSDYIDKIDIMGSQFDIQDTITKGVATQNTEDIEGVEGDISNLETEIAKRPIQLCFSNISVSTSEWVDQSTTPDVLGFPYRATITASGVTSDFSPDVRFSSESATSGNLAPVANCGLGCVYIYAKSIPTESVVISSIICTKVV